MSLTILTRYKAVADVLTPEAMERFLMERFLEDKEFERKFGNSLRKRSRWEILQQFRSDMDSYWAEAVLVLCIALGIFGWSAMHFFGWLSWR